MSACGVKPESDRLALTTAQLIPSGNRSALQTRQSSVDLRTLQGEKEDERKERESTTATGDSVRIPPALRRQLEDEAGRVRLPTWEELQRLSPAERRIVVDYFRRLSAPAR